MIKCLIKSNKSSFKALMLTLGGRIGVGSISGVAICIYYGGVGSLFWMFIFSIVGASITMVETILGLIYKKNGYGSPCNYLESCKGKAILYSILIYLHQPYLSFKLILVLKVWKKHSVI